MAKATESYCSDYSQYLPSYAAWGLDVGPGYYAPPTVGAAGWNYGARDPGRVVDPKQNDAILQGPAQPWEGDWCEPYSGLGGYPAVLFRTIYCGSNQTSLIAPGPADVDGWPIWTTTVNPKGHLNMGPVGLGFLLGGGYLGDARAFYCPSTGGTMPIDEGIGAGHVCSSPQDLQRAGGYDAKSVSSGDWTWLNLTADKYWPGIALQCDYNYRNVPVTLPFTGLWDVAYTYLSYNGEAKFPYISPNLTTQAGCPMFKTQKLLGGRALVSDSFSQGDPTPIPPVAGKGQYAHKDGYNVLYGDWSAKWYGDPQQGIMWWKGIPTPGDSYAYLEIPMASLQINAPWHYFSRNTDGSAWGSLAWDYIDWTYTAGDTAHPNERSDGVWHMLDVGVGIDVR